MEHVLYLVTFDDRGNAQHADGIGVGNEDCHWRMYLHVFHAWTVAMHSDRPRMVFKESKQTVRSDIQAQL